MVITVEENFPRGGTKISKPPKRKSDTFLFGSKKEQKSKKRRKEEPQKDTSDELWQSSLRLQGTLTYKKMHTNMIVLSCVRHISNLAFQVELPGLTFATVALDQISDAFTKRVAENLRNSDDSSLKNLKSIVKIGDLIPVKILSIEEKEKGYNVQASTNPKMINSNWKHYSFQKGNLIWANITSELDHGYELSVGKDNCRVFLPFKNIDENTKYDIGQPLFCKIHRVETSSIATTLTVSTKNQHINQIFDDELTLDTLIPGTKLKFVVEKLLPHGAQGRISETVIGYLDESQMFSKVKPREGMSIDTHVLFIEPITKVTYLSLCGLDRLPEPNHEVGKIVQGQVTSNASNGIYLKIGKISRGFVTNKRLLKGLPSKNPEIRKKYPVGSSHECRILDYNYMQQLYICTFEKQLISEKVFNVKDLSIGQSASVKIEKIVSNGIVVKSGQVQGFVPNLHLSNVKYSDVIKSKFVEGVKVNARVLNITEDNVLFTLKQGLVEAAEANCLVNKDAVQFGHPYVGSVAQTKTSGALIAFYGTVTGWISSKTLNSENPGSYVDPNDYFFVGQVVTVYVTGLKNNRFQLSLTGVKRQKKKMTLGEVCKGTVNQIRSDGLMLQLGRRKIDAFLPLTHLCDNIDLCESIYRVYKIGDQIGKLVCVDNLKEVPIVSRREFWARKNGVPKFHDLKKGMFLRCSFEGRSEGGVLVSTPLSDYSEKILIEGVETDFNEQQHILAKIVHLEYTPKKIVLDIVNSGKKDVLAKLKDTFSDLDNIHKIYTKKNKNFVAYQIGERVQCSIENKNPDGSCVVLLPNGTKGHMSSNLSPQNCEIGTQLETVILDYNYVDNCLEVCGKNKEKQKINKIQDGATKNPDHTTSLVRILLRTKFYVLGVLTGRQLVYLPPNLDYSGDKEKLKVVICGRIGRRIIALPKKYYLSLGVKKRTLLPNEDEVKEETSKEATPGEVKSKKRKKVKSDQATPGEVEPKKQKKVKSDQATPGEVEPRKQKKEKLVSDLEEQKSPKSPQEKKPVLSSTSSFYNLDDNIDSGIQSSSSDDEEEENKDQTKKKKKLRASEKAELVKKTEEEIAKVEKELADMSTNPQTADQFDRLVLSKPNSSQIWLQYMSMHIANAELDKARSIARRAIETIDITQIKEKFNVWVALLNLENMYGSKESFDSVFEEAVKYNDSLDVYLSAINILATSGKLAEMEGKIKKVRNKMKHDSKMWLEIGKIYYSLDKFKEARNFKDGALKSITDHKKQFDLIMRFAIMEFQMGELDQAIANFETLIDTYPKKVNIWTIYVDQLVKREKIDLARKVLERAVGQKFGLKIMKTLFQKFVSFEEKHGSPETVAGVKNRAKEYVTNVSV